jgi:hypothetical protein
MSNPTFQAEFSHHHRQWLLRIRSSTKSKTSSIPSSCESVYFISSSGRATQCQTILGNPHLTFPMPKISLIRSMLSTPTSLRFLCLLRRQQQKGEVVQSAKSTSSAPRLFFFSSSVSSAFFGVHLLDARLILHVTTFKLGGPRPTEGGVIVIKHEYQPGGTSGIPRCHDPIGK